MISAAIMPVWAMESRQERRVEELQLLNSARTSASILAHRRRVRAVCHFPAQRARKSPFRIQEQSPVDAQRGAPRKKSYPPFRESTVEKRDRMSLDPLHARNSIVCIPSSAVPGGLHVAILLFHVDRYGGAQFITRSIGVSPQISQNRQDRGANNRTPVECVPRIRDPTAYECPLLAPGRATSELWCQADLGVRVRTNDDFNDA